MHSFEPTRRAVLVAAFVVPTLARAATAPTVEVWKSPACGCCGGWVTHLRAAGFSVVVRDVDDVDPIKRTHGVTTELASCHTALVEGYVVEGHAPASDIRRLLAESRAIKGLAAPGMPSGAPGMGEDGSRYDVVAFGGAGGTSVFARH